VRPDSASIHLGEIAASISPRESVGAAPPTLASGPKNGHSLELTRDIRDQEAGLVPTLGTGSRPGSGLKSSSVLSLVHPTSTLQHSQPVSVSLQEPLVAGMQIVQENSPLSPFSATLGSILLNTDGLLEVADTLDLQGSTATYRAESPVAEFPTLQLHVGSPIQLSAAEVPMFRNYVENVSRWVSAPRILPHDLSSSKTQYGKGFEMYYLKNSLTPTLGRLILA
jgi:hypothetical protein